VAADGEGCLEILAHRLRERPGIVAIEADFSDHTLTVRYRPALVSPDELNALADDVGTLFSQRVTACEKRESLDACEACALRLGRLDPGSAAEFRASATARLARPARRARRRRRVVRPLTHKPWGARLTHEGRPSARRAAHRAHRLLPGAARGQRRGRLGMTPAVADALFLVSAIGGWYTAASTLRAAVAELEFATSTCSCCSPPAHARSVTSPKPRC
jgi:hypothetical protein